MSETTETPAVRVKFGPGDSDDVSLAIASRMLRILREKHPDMFGKVFLEAYGIEKKARARANGARP
jgi:hypothetical protein